MLSVSSTAVDNGRFCSGCRNASTCGASAGRIEIRGLAGPAGGSGTAVLRLPDGAFRAVRAGDAFELEDAGVRVPFSVRGVDAGGVSLDAPSLPGGTFELRESFPAGAAEAPEGTLAAFVAEDLPLRLAARLLASATGENVVVSPAAGETTTFVTLPLPSQETTTAPFPREASPPAHAYAVSEAASGRTHVARAAA